MLSPNEGNLGNAASCVLPMIRTMGFSDHLVILSPTIDALEVSCFLGPHLSDPTCMLSRKPVCGTRCLCWLTMTFHPISTHCAQVMAKTRRGVLLRPPSMKVALRPQIMGLSGCLDHLRQHFRAGSQYQRGWWPLPSLFVWLMVMNGSVSASEGSDCFACGVLTSVCFLFSLALLASDPKKKWALWGWTVGIFYTCLVC